MKRKLYRSILAASSLMLVTFSGTLLADAAADITVSGAYVRATAPEQPNSAAFMKLHNGGMENHAVVSAEGDAAKVIELHTHISEGGMMKMRQIDKIDLPAHSDVDLKPGGYHVMLIGLKQAAKEGDSIHLTLVFNDGSKKMVNAPVKKMQMKMGAGEHSHGGGHDMKMKKPASKMDHSMH